MPSAPSKQPAADASKSTSTPNSTEQPLKDQKPAAPLEEDDEFEDFPVEGTDSLPRLARPPPGETSKRKDGHEEVLCTHLWRGSRDKDSTSKHIDTEANLSLDWAEEETQLPGGNAHLWEESWDDDDTNEEFAVQLR
jgi:26 proteasome complex subunit DSS1